jgi:hypothetical protein
MELPASWGLKTKKQKDGKLSVIGKDDAGNEYRARICDSGTVTPTDVAELAAADRERYANREDGARKFVDGLVAGGKARRTAEEQLFENELVEAAGPIVRAGLEREQSFVGGYHGEARRNYDAWVASLREDN